MLKGITHLICVGYTMNKEGLHDLTNTGQIERKVGRGNSLQLNVFVRMVGIAGTKRHGKESNVVDQNAAHKRNL